MSFIFVPLPQLNLWPLRLVASDFHVMLAFAVHLHFIPAWTYGLRLALQKLGTLNISQTLWFIYHNGVVGEVYWFHSVRPSVCWGTTGWRFVINSRADIHVTIDCSTVLPFVLVVVTRQKPQINGSVVLAADESLWPRGTPSWYTPLSWMILSKQKNLHLFSSQYICVYLQEVRPSICLSHIPCPLCSTYSSGCSHLIFIHLIEQLQKMCRV